MNAKIKIGGDKKIVCTLLKDAEGHDIDQSVDNIYALKWSFGVADAYPIGAVSYLESPDKQAHVQIPAANVDLDLGNGWTFHADVDNKVYRLAYHGTIVKGIQYIEVDASRSLVDGEPKTKIIVSFVTLIGHLFTSVEFVNDEPVFKSGTTLLGCLTRGNISCVASRRPTCEATLVIESEG